MQLQAGELVVDIKVNSADAIAALRAIEQQGRQAAQTLQSRLVAAHTAAAQSSTRQATSLQRTQDTMLRMAMAEARLASTTGDTAQAVRVLEQALQNVTERTRTVVQAQTMLARQQQQLTTTTRSMRENLERLAQVGGLVSSAVFAVSTAFGASLLTGAAVEAGRLALELDNVQVSLRAIAGSQTLYNQALEQAAAFQRVYGGTLSENVALMQDFVMISKRTGAEMERLVETAQLLAIVKPEQGITGASYALSELLAGDLVSIVERFNLSRSAVREYLNEFRRTGDANRLLAGINELLEKQGVTLDVVQQRAEALSATYNQLGASLERLQRNAGQALAEGFAPAARGLSFVLDTLAGAPTEVDRAVQSIGKQLLENATSFTEYQNAIKAANAELGSLRNQQFIGVAIPNIEQLSEAQFTYLQYLRLTGESFDEAYSRAAQYGQELIDIGDGQYTLVEQADALRRAQDLLTQAQIDSAEQARRTSLAVENQARTVYQDVANKLLARAETERLSVAQQQLDQALLSVAYSGTVLDTQVRAISAQFSLTEQEVRSLIAEYQNLITAQQNATIATTAVASTQLLAAYQTQLVQQRQQEMANAIQNAAAVIQASAGDSAVFEQTVAQLSSELNINIDVARSLIDTYLELQAASTSNEQSLNQLLLARFEETTRSEAAASAYALLEAALRDAALSGEDTTVVSQRLAQQFGVEADQVYQAIIAYQQLQQQQHMTGASGYQLAAVQLDNMLQAQLLRVAHDELAVAVEAVANESGDTSARIAELAKRYNLTETTVRRLVDAYRNLKQARDTAARSLASLQVPPLQNPFLPRQPRSSGVPRKSDEQRELERQQREQEQLQERIQRDTERHYERLAQLYDQFTERMRQAEQKFAQDQLEGRADFYNALARFEDNQLRTRLSAAYEQGVLEAQALASEKGADVANAYLDELTRVLLARAKREQDIADALAEGDSASADYLRGVDALYRRAEDAKLERIKQGEQSIRAEYEQSVLEQNQQFAKAAQEWTLHEQQKKQAVQETNVVLREQLELAKQLAGVGGRGDAKLPVGGVTIPSTGTVEELLRRIEQSIKDVQRVLESLRLSSVVGV